MEARMRSTSFYTVQEFCQEFNIRESGLESMLNEGEGPLTMTICGRTIIPDIAAEEWFDSWTEKYGIPKEHWRNASPTTVDASPPVSKAATRRNHRTATD